MQHAGVPKRCAIARLFGAARRGLCGYVRDDALFSQAGTGGFATFQVTLPLTAMLRKQRDAGGTVHFRYARKPGISRRAKRNTIGKKLR